MVFQDFLLEKTLEKVINCLIYKYTVTNQEHEIEKYASYFPKEIYKLVVVCHLKFTPTAV